MLIYGGEERLRGCSLQRRALALWSAECFKGMGEAASCDHLACRFKWSLPHMHTEKRPCHEPFQEQGGSKT